MGKNKVELDKNKVEELLNEQINFWRKRKNKSPKGDYTQDEWEAFCTGGVKALESAWRSLTK